MDWSEVLTDSEGNYMLGVLDVLQPAFPKYRRYSVRREGDSAIRIMKL